MSTTLSNLPAAESSTAAHRLRSSMAAIRVGFTWFGTRKTLSREQRQRAAESFGAEGAFLSAGKKLIDTRDARFKAVTTIRNRASSYWKSVSLPFPEPAVRLIRQQDIEPFNHQLSIYANELDEAVAVLNERYAELKTSARERLGTLYSEADYPASLVGLFEIAWDFPSVEPPTYLQQLNPELYEEECRRVAARFDDAVQLAEQAFLDELSQLVSHLTERLSGHEDGRPKTFRDTAVGNLNEFFERFRTLNVRSNEQLDDLVEQCHEIVRGVPPQALRTQEGLRRQVSAQLSGVQSVLDGMLVDRPRRRIIRSPK
jgi:hypothetical protein